MRKRMKMGVRMAEESDMDTVLTLINDGRIYLRERGLPQWQYGTGPTPEILAQDIDNMEGYIFTLDGVAAGYAALTIEPDVYYSIIDGAWDETHSEYITLHRMSMRKSLRGQGFSKRFMWLLMKEVKRMGYKDLRVDTHPDNDVMIGLLKRASFIFRGVVTFPFEHGERNAYQIIFKSKERRAADSPEEGDAQDTGDVQDADSPRDRDDADDRNDLDDMDDEDEDEGDLDEF